MTRDNIRHLPRLSLSSAMRVFGLTARALRFYEEKGLIEARRDRLNCRYYDGAARVRLEWIAKLRQAQVSLPDIEEVLEADDDAQRRDCARAKLARRRDAVLKDLAAIDAVLAELDGPATPAKRLAGA
ncbi:MerR family transcriptional regulator [Phenylobacterium sp.]|uniref:helix-turn-helix domain-containing protein n=1 Tax=Phenylobacterium sp. TaxID=1871053 RepID=UPI0035AE3B54